ncbi:MAG: hypothetical protein AAF403_07260, partial [Pseudomonadota bacterium]
MTSLLSAFWVMLSWMLLLSKPVLADSGLPQLNPSHFLSQIFWLAICFSIFYIVISRIALPRIGESLDQRANEINHNLERAKKLNDEAQELQNKKDQILTEAHEKGHRMIADAHEKIKSTMQKKLNEFDQKITEEINANERKATDAYQKTVDELSEHAQHIAEDIVVAIT